MTISENSSQNGSGRYIDYADPRPDQFTYQDISQGLARECRFNGQTREHYSVAQHSVLVSLVVPKEYALEALVHDGSEAFMRDISTPLKVLLPDYKRIEERVQGAVHSHFGLPERLPLDAAQAVKRGDQLLTYTERLQLMPQDDRPWPGMFESPLDFLIVPMEHKEAAMYFEARLASIMEERPFLQEMDLWTKQHFEWSVRHERQEREEGDTHPRMRMAG